MTAHRKKLLACDFSRTLLRAVPATLMLAALSQVPMAQAQVAAESAVITKGTVTAVTGGAAHKGASRTGSKGATARRGHAVPGGAAAQGGSQVPGAGIANSSGPLMQADRGGPVDVGPQMNLIVGKSTLLRTTDAISRISIGSPGIADVTLISSRELYLIGKAFGTTNVMLWRSGGGTTVIDVTVGVDTAALQTQLHTLLPGEKGIQVRSAADSIVLSGTVSSAIRATEAVELAEGFLRAYSRGIVLPVTAGSTTVAPGEKMTAGQTQMVMQAQFRPKVINIMKIAQPMQVMLEVKVAEVSRTLLDKLGSSFNFAKTNGNWTYRLLSGFTSEGSGALGAGHSNGSSLLFDAEKKDGLVKILAEPSLVAISGQEASFLAGGKIFIPVARTNNAGIATITLEEKEFGVGLKFMPLVMDHNQIVLKVSPEVSEVTQSGNPFTTINGVTTILPGFTVRKAQTTVQMMDGQSLAIGGLIKNNVTETMSKMPVLGEIPVLGALFRSAEFQNDRSELIFLITPRLIKPLSGEVMVPTDNFVPPSRGEFFGGGLLEGSGNQDVPPDRPRAQPNALPNAPLRGGAGLEMK